MPTYEYACRDCGEHLEVVQSFRDDALEVCPNCDGELRKVFSPAGIIFKGSGWHIKDYGTSSSRPSAPPASGDGDAAPGGSSEKPAATDDSTEKSA